MATKSSNQQLPREIWTGHKTIKKSSYCCPIKCEVLKNLDLNIQKMLTAISLHQSWKPLTL